MTDFNETTMLWATIVSLLLAAFIVRGLMGMLRTKKHTSHKHHLLEMGKEKEIFFVPGDEYLEQDDERRSR